MENALEEVKEGKTRGKGATCERKFVGKKMKSRPLRMHFHHSGAKIKGCEQSTDIINFDFFIRLQHMNTLFKLG